MLKGLLVTSFVEVFLVGLEVVMVKKLNQNLYIKLFLEVIMVSIKLSKVLVINFAKEFNYKLGVKFYL